MELRQRVDNTGVEAAVTGILRSQSGAVVWSGQLTASGMPDYYHAIIDPDDLSAPFQHATRYEVEVTAIHNGRTGHWVDRVIVVARRSSDANQS